MHRCSSAALALLVILPLGLPAQDSRPTVVRGRVVAAGSDSPPPNVTLQLREGRRSREGRAIAVGADGTFEAPTSRPGNYVLVARASGFVSLTKPVVVPTSGPVDMLLERGATVRGIVLDRRDRKPVPGAQITQGIGSEPVGTGPDGSFTLDGLPPGDETVSFGVRAKGYAFLEATARPDGSEPMTLLLEPGWVAAVRVVDEHLSPMSDAEVHARLPFAIAYSSLDRQDFPAKTDAAGIARVEGLPPGQPVVFEVTTDGVSTQSAVVLPERPERDGPPVGPAAQIVAGLGTWTTFRIESPDDEPVPGAEIHVRPAVAGRLDVRGLVTESPERGSVRDASSGADGTLTLNQLPRQVLTAEIRAKGFLTQVVTFEPGTGVTGSGADADSHVVHVELAHDSDPPPASVPWQPSADAAFRLAREAQRPILFALAMDGETANDAMAEHHFRDPAVVQTLRAMPCVISNVFGPGGRIAPGVAHMEVDGVCSRYGRIPCRAHQEVEPWIRSTLIGKAPFQVPKHIFVSPEGEVLIDRGYYLGERDLMNLAMRAMRRCNPEIAMAMAAERLAPLRARLNDDDPDVRQSAARHLTTLVNAGDEWATALLLELGQLGLRADERVSVLDALILDAIAMPASALGGFAHDADPAVRRRVFERLADRAGDPPVLELLTDCLIDDDPEAGATLLRALRVRQVEERWVVDDPLAAERWRIVVKLMTAVDPEAIGGATEVLGDPRCPGRNAALRVLAAHPDVGAAVRRLIPLAGQDDSSAVAALRALDPLLALVDESAPALKTVFAQSRNASALVRQEAARLIGRHARSRDGRARLEEMLTDSEVVVRWTAAIALFRDGGDAGSNLVIAALNDPELGDQARDGLLERYVNAHPTTAAEWSAWLASHPGASHRGPESKEK